MGCFKNANSPELLRLVLFVSIANSKASILLAAFCEKSVLEFCTGNSEHRLDGVVCFSFVSSWALLISPLPSTFFLFSKQRERELTAIYIYTVYRKSSFHRLIAWSKFIVKRFGNTLTPCRWPCFKSWTLSFTKRVTVYHTSDAMHRGFMSNVQREGCFRLWNPWWRQRCALLGVMRTFFFIKTYGDDECFFLNFFFRRRRKKEKKSWSSFTFLFYDFILEVFSKRGTTAVLNLSVVLVRFVPLLFLRGLPAAPREEDGLALCRHSRCDGSERKFGLSKLFWDYSMCASWECRRFPTVNAVETQGFFSLRNDALVSWLCFSSLLTSSTGEELRLGGGANGVCKMLNAWWTCNAVQLWICGKRRVWSNDATK